MTNPSPTDLITKATPPIEWLAENTDCPGLPDWCAADGPSITQYQPGHWVAAVTNPPAVLAAICMWVMDVADWHAVGYWKFERLGSQDHPVYAWVFEDEQELSVLSGEHVGPRPEATIALLLAIVECLKGESK